VEFRTIDEQNVKIGITYGKEDDEDTEIGSWNDNWLIIFTFFVIQIRYIR
jgi:hypothetical protein